MPSTDRRTILRAAATLPAFASLAPGTAFAQATPGEPQKPAAPVASPPPHVTHILAQYIVNARYDDLPENVRKEGVRTLLNWAGVAIGGSHHKTVDIAVSALAPFSGPAQASLFGRRERFDIMNAAFINGVSSHIFDYDDTHLKTIIHPAGPVASAILALSEMQPVSGKDFLNALVLGVETNAGSAMRSIPITMTSAGTSPAPPACSDRQRRPASCSASTSSRWSGRLGSRRRSRWACVNPSAP